MRVQEVGLLLAGGLCACSLLHAEATNPAATPPPATVAPLPMSDVCLASEAHRKRATALLQQGRLDRTVRALREADHLCPSLAHKSWAALVATLGELGRYEEMSALLSEVAKAGPLPHEVSVAASRWANVDETHVDAMSLLEAAFGVSNPVQRRRQLDRAMTALEFQTDTTATLDARNGFWGGVDAVAWHEDRLAVVAGPIYILDATTFNVLRELPRPPGEVDSLRFVDDGRRLLAGSDEDSLALWDLTTGELVRATSWREDVHVAGLFGQGAAQHVEVVRKTEAGPTWSPLESDENVLKMDRLEAAATVSQDHAWLAMRHDNDIDIFRIGERRKRFTLHSAEGRNGVTDLLAFSPDATRLAAVEGDFDIAVFDLKRPGRPKRLTHDGTVLTFVFSNDGRRLASGSWDQTVRVWDVDQGTELFRAPNDKEVVAVAFSPAGRRLASGTPDGVLRIWDLDTKREVHRRAPHVPRVDALEFAADGSLIAGMSDGTVRIWGPRFVTLSGIEGSVARTQLTPNGTLIATNIHNGLEVWNVAERRSLKKLPDRSQFMMPSAFDASASFVFFGDIDGTVAKVEIATGRELWRKPVASSVRSVAVSHDGATLAVGSRDHELHLVDAGTGAVQRTIGGHTWMVDEAFFTTDDRRLISRGGDVRVFDVRTGKSLLQHREMGGTVDRIALSPDDKHVLVASSKGTTALLEVNSGREVRRYDMAGLRPWTLAFSPDGRLFAASSWQRDCGIWSVETGKRLVNLEAVEALDAGFVRTPDGHLELVGSERRQARKYLACRFGELTVPFEVCEDRLSVEGVFGTLPPSPRK